VVLVSGKQVRSRKEKKKKRKEKKKQPTKLSKGMRWYRSHALAVDLCFWMLS
jgi:hypothetical protein